MQSFLCVTEPPFPNSVPLELYTAFAQITQKIIITATCHWLEPITIILGFLKTFTFRGASTHFRTIVFSHNPRFQFSSPTLDGLCVSFNAHHFFMQKPLMCVHCYTGRSILSSIILYKRAIRWILVARQAEMRKDECVPEVVAYEENLIVINYWREILQFNQEFSPQIRPSVTILGSNSKRFRGFNPWTSIRGLTVIGWLVRWICVSPAIDF